MDPPSIPMETQILSPTFEQMEQLADHLRSGQIAAIPTETVYGLAGHALDPQAVAQIFAVKERPRFDPLITHIPQPQDRSYLAYLESELDLVDLSSFSPDQKQSLEDLLQTLWPGPLTVVLPKTSKLPDLVTSGLPTLALRMPRHPVAQQMLTLAQIPLAAPSANRFGRISPTSAAAVFSELQGRIAYILDGGECEIGLESTVIAIDPHQGITLLRPGAITLDQIQPITALPIGSAQVEQRIPVAPGQLPSHYAPGKPFLMLPAPLPQITFADWEQILSSYTPQKIGILLFSQDSEPQLTLWRDRFPLPIDREILSPTGDLTEAARTLFAKLRRLDQSEADLLLTEPCPIDTGLGYAIADRLRRATAKR